MQDFRRHINTGDKALLLGLVLFDVILLWARLFYAVEANTISLIAVSATVASAWLIFRPESYSFDENALYIQRRLPRSEIRIPYTAVTECDPIGKYLEFKRDADAAELMIKYRLMENGAFREKRVACHPERNQLFYSLLCDKCPALKNRCKDRPSGNEVLDKLSKM